MEAFHSYRNGMSSPFIYECKGAIPFLILYLQFSKSKSSEANVKHVISKLSFSVCPVTQFFNKVIFYFFWPHDISKGKILIRSQPNWVHISWGEGRARQNVLTLTQSQISFTLEKGQLFLNQMQWGGKSSIFDLTTESAFTDSVLGLKAVEGICSGEAHWWHKGKAPS